MSNTVSTFDFNTLINDVATAHKVRVVAIDGEPWFVLKDIAETLGFTRHEKYGYTRSTRGLSAEQIRVLNRYKEASAPDAEAWALWAPEDSRVWQLKAVSEAGLYKLIMRSDKSVARPFQDWVTREVLPSIRKTGGYTLAPGETMPLPPSITEAFKEAYAKAKAEFQERLEKAEGEALKWRASAPRPVGSRRRNGRIKRVTVRLIPPWRL